VQGIALIPLFVVAIRYPDWGPFRLLNLRAVSFLGVLSYPLYLVHHVVLRALSSWLDVGVLRALFALIVSTAIAWALYAFVEKPSARLRRWLSRPRVSALGNEAPPLVVNLAEARDQ
jgi:peptidoglycan/LPS O-acetylase OafA/YrhL